jgi:hypothetical protein
MKPRPSTMFSEPPSWRFAPAQVQADMTAQEIAMDMPIGETAMR